MHEMIEDYTENVEGGKGIMVLRGVPASGKSTHALDLVRSIGKHNAVRVSRDDLRFMLYGHERSEDALSFKHEGFVTKVQEFIVNEALSQDGYAVIDDTNLRNAYVRKWHRIAKAHAASFRSLIFDIDPDEARERNSQRVSPVKSSAYDNLKRFLNGSKVRRYTPKQPEDVHKTDAYAGLVAELKPKVKASKDGAPACLIVDIDGTIARSTGRSPYDYTRVHEDEAVVEVRAAMHALALSPVHFDYEAMPVFLVSGRTGSKECREATEAWLEANSFNYTDLFMRAEGDTRSDALVKAELFRDNILGKGYDALWVLDDRNSVVKMWRDLGLTCFQVADGNF